MKIVIIEGVDNTGKDTVIKSLSELFDSAVVFHCEKPKSTTFIEQAEEQKNEFASLLGKTIYQYISKIDNIDNNSICIHNRSWYGEYVYGCMYRYNSPEEVIKMVDILEQGLCKVVNQEDICFITLLSNNIDFLVKNDDGLSISEAKKELIDEEVHRFEKIAEYSHLYNKHVIYVNDGDKFRPKEDIMNEIKRYIGI